MHQCITGAMNKAVARHGWDAIVKIAQDGSFGPLDTMRLFDSTDVETAEVEMLDRLLGTELAALFRNQA